MTVKARYGWGRTARCITANGITKEPRFIVEDLLEAGRKHPAENHVKRVAPSLIERNPSLFPEIAREMPIQYYDADWFNNHPAHARTKLGVQLIVVFVPNSPAFLSGHGDDALTVKALTEKYGLEVFANYDLAYVTKKATSGNSQANSDDSGESVGSRDSTDESDGESVGSFISDDEEAMAEDAQEFRSERCNPPAFAASYDTDLEAQIFGGDSDLEESSV
ncbi:hypothetical protein B0H10DRAFT_2064312 [Mycena sp. CBHHK59/15]|nr:hypothetical protein B0H10DRAFT_2064312 [Mycena sp. CBHHK59/15]